MVMDECSQCTHPHLTACATDECWYTVKCCWHTGVLLVWMLLFDSWPGDHTYDKISLSGKFKTPV
jgi:hypothetical protein